MGKITYLLLTLICIEMMFFVFYDVGSGSLNSATFTVIETMANGGTWTQAMGAFFDDISLKVIALSVLTAAAGIFLAYRGSQSNTETYIWATIASTFLINMGADYVYIYKILAGCADSTTASCIAGIRPLFALVIMVPILFLFGWLVLEWVRKTD